MNTIKKYMGVVWLILGPVFIYLMVSGAVANISSTGTKDINRPLPWVIIISIFTPICIGLMIFGWYCLKGEYERLEQETF